MPTLMLCWSSTTLGQKRLCLHKTGRHHSGIPHLKLDPPWLCHVNKHFPWLCMWSTVKCLTSQGVTPTFCRVYNCIWVHGNSKSSVNILHILQVLNQKSRMQIMGLEQRSNPSCPTICSRGKNIYIAFPTSWTWDILAQHNFTVWKASPTWVLTQRENAGQEHLPGNSAETGAARGAERARLQLTPSSAGATTEDGHWFCTTNVSCKSSRNHCLWSNLKTIIHHCFTHSRYFSGLKAQVNHSSF